MSERRETPAQLDHAIDALLGQRAHLRPVGEGELVATARLLRDALPRFHPRFGFEELLARQLVAAGGAVAGAGQSLFVGGPAAPHARPGDRGELVLLPVASPGEGAGRATDRRRRGLLAGGAIASGVSLAIPIAGAALVAWRRTRPPGGIL